MEHLQQETLDWRRVDEAEEFAALWMAVRGVCNLAIFVIGQPLIPALLESGIVFVVCFCSLPRASSKCHGQENDGAGPDIQGARVIWTLFVEDLWGNVRQAAADAWIGETDLAHVLTTLTPGLTQARMLTAKDLGNTEIRNLEMAVLAEKQVFQLDITMSNAVSMQVIDASQELLEEAKTILDGVVALRAGGE